MAKDCVVNARRSMNVEEYSEPALGGSVAAPTGQAVTPTCDPDLAYRPADFPTLPAALDYAAAGSGGLNFHDRRGNPSAVLTYAELRRRARVRARGLLACGLHRGDRVAIVAEVGPSFAVGFFACQYAGLHAVPVPARTGLGTSESYIDTVRRILRSAHVRLVLAPEADQRALKAAAAGLPVDRVTSLSDLDAGPDAPGLDLCPLGPAEMSHIQYSSGSTRDPQGIQITQQGLMANAQRVVRDGLAITDRDRGTSWLPFYHDMGLIGFLLIPVTCQMSVDYLSPETFARRPTLWLELIARNRGTIAFSPTFGYELCTRRAHRVAGLDLSSWRVAGVGGERVRAETLAAFTRTFGSAGFRHAAFTPSYGLAETTLAVSFHTLAREPAVDVVDPTGLMHDGAARPATRDGASAASRFVSCGRPLPDHEVQIRDPAGRPLGERSVGRIVVSGPSLMRGYDGDDAPLGTGDGGLDTGDLGYLADGQLFVTGRRKDLIIVNGRNVAPQDLEWIAEQAGEGLSARDTAAFSILDRSDREVPVVLVQLRAQNPDIRKRVCDQVHAALFRSAGIDCRIVPIPPRSLPFTSSGKLSRTKARDLYLAGAFEIDRPSPAVSG